MKSNDHKKECAVDHYRFACKNSRRRRLRQEKKRARAVTRRRNKQIEREGKGGME